jgi:hypothetical protein
MSCQYPGMTHRLRRCFTEVSSSNEKAGANDVECEFCVVLRRARELEVFDPLPGLCSPLTPGVQLANLSLNHKSMRRAHGWCFTAGQILGDHRSFSSPMPWRCVARKSQKMVMVHPDDGDKEIAHRIAYHRRPERQKCRKGRLRRRLEFQHHNCDDYSEDAVRERSQPFRRRSSMVLHTLRRFLFAKKS